MATAEPDDPTDWFESVYRAAGRGGATVPWHRGGPEPLLVRATFGWDGVGDRAIVIGCGLGDDAEHVASLGYRTVAFDVSGSAIAQARQRFPESTVDYRTADLLALPSEWHRTFDLVVENFTVQSLPHSVRAQAIVHVADLVAADGGILLVHASVRPEGAAARPGPPWPLRRTEIDAFATDGLVAHHVEEMPGPGDPPSTVWQAKFRRP